MKRLLAPHLMIIGAASRNVGKTEFAAAVLRQQQHCVAVKVTTIHDESRGCPRGQGCGVCQSLQGAFCLSELIDEVVDAGNKDTARLRAAGAQRVWWLRARKSHLFEAAQCLLETLPPELCCVCESNSLALVLEASVFALLHRPPEPVKPSAQAVWDLATVRVHSTGQGFDPMPERFRCNDGRWQFV